jgi:hypothetical protein
MNNVVSQRTTLDLYKALGVNTSDTKSIAIDLSVTPATIDIADASTESRLVLAANGTDDPFFVGVEICKALGLDPTKIHGLKLFFGADLPRYEITNYICTDDGRALAEAFNSCHIIETEAA